MGKIITQAPAIEIKAKQLPPEFIETLMSDAYQKELAEYNAECDKLKRQAESAPELVKMLESLLFIAESVAHLKRLEREIIPTTEAIRAKLEQLKG